MPGSDCEGASPGDGGERGDGGEQGGEVGEDADADDRERYTGVYAHIERGADLGPLIAGLTRDGCSPGRGAFSLRAAHRSVRAGLGHVRDRLQRPGAHPAPSCGSAPLGYEITVQHANGKISRGGRVNRGMRATNGKIGPRVPLAVIKAKYAPYLKRGKPTHLDFLRDHTDFDIVSIYGAQYRGIVQYYLLAADVWRLDRLKGVMLTSMLKTLAAKHRSTVTKMANKHKTTIATPHGPRRCFEARRERAGRKPLAARFGGIPLKRQKTAVLTAPIAPRRPGSQLLQRLTHGRCELCGTPAQVHVHQVRKLAELATAGQPQPKWAQLMARMRRKTLIVCPPCHHHIHTGQPTATITHKSLESRTH